MEYVECPKCKNKMQIYRGDAQAVFPGMGTSKTDALTLFCEKCKYNEIFARIK